jgi:hypothetical protein
VWGVGESEGGVDCRCVCGRGECAAVVLVHPSPLSVFVGSGEDGGMGGRAGGWKGEGGKGWGGELRVVRLYVIDQARQGW